MSDCRPCTFATRRNGHAAAANRITAISVGRDCRNDHRAYGAKVGGPNTDKISAGGVDVHHVSILPVCLSDIDTPLESNLRTAY